MDDLTLSVRTDTSSKNPESSVSYCEILAENGSRRGCWVTYTFTLRNGCSVFVVCHDFEMCDEMAESGQGVWVMRTFQVVDKERGQVAGFVGEWQADLIDPQHRATEEE